MKIEKVYVEFGGDPSDDKECYKRYCSTEPFDTSFPNAEVIPFVAEWKVKEFFGKVKNLHDEIASLKDTKWFNPITNKWEPTVSVYRANKLMEALKPFGDLG